MPIYEYRCDSCGFQKEYILRMSDAPLTDCPECKKSTFTKMVTAAGFQLKGSTGHGEAENEFGSPLTTQSKGGGASIEGTSGNGPQINLETDRGTVSVKKL